MLTKDAIRSAIMEILDGSEDLTECEIYRALRDEMHSGITDRDASRALGSLLADKQVTEVIERDPHGAHTGMPSLYHRTANQMRS